VPEYVPTDYRHLTKPARWASRAFFVVVVADVASIVVTGAEFNIIDRAQHGKATLDELLMFDHRQSVVLLAQVLAHAVAGILFLRWFHRAYRNLLSLGTKRRWRAGWAIGYWFIPILSLFRPKQIANEIWRGSNPALGSGRSSSIPAVLSLWWGAWIIAVLFSYIARSSENTARTLDDLAFACTMWVWTDLLALTAAILAMRVIKRITERQETRARAIGRAAFGAGPS
jgi:hypothetical protein